MRIVTFVQFGEQTQLHKGSFSHYLYTTKRTLSQILNLTYSVSINLIKTHKKGLKKKY